MIRFAAVLALLLAFCGGVAAQGLVKDAEGLFTTKSVEGTATLARGQRLTINAASTLGGKIVLTAGGNDCRYTYKKILKTPTKTEAAEYAEIITVDVEQQRDQVVFSLRAPARTPWSGTSNSGRLEIHIKLPDSCIVVINTAYFDVEAVGPFSEFNVTETLSKVSVENVLGRVDVKVSNRPLSIHDVQGQVLATNQYGPIRLEGVDTGESLATVRNEHGEISLDACRGSFDLRTSYDRIVGQHLFLTGSKNRIKNVSGIINLDLDSLTTGRLRINNNYGSISLNVNNRVDAQFICKIEEGSRVTAEHMDMIPGLVYDTRLEFETGEGAAEVRLTAGGSGDINIVGPGRKGNEDQ